MGRNIDKVIASLSKERQAKILERTEEILRERNPFVKLAMFRKAGSHRKSEKTSRQQGKKEVLE